MTTPLPNPAALLQAAQTQTLVNRYLFLKQQQLGQIIRQVKKA